MMQFTLIHAFCTLTSERSAKVQTYLGSWLMRICSMYEVKGKILNKLKKQKIMVIWTDSWMVLPANTQIIRSFHISLIWEQASKSPSQPFQENMMCLNFTSSEDHTFPLPFTACVFTKVLCVLHHSKQWEKQLYIMRPDRREHYDIDEVCTRN